MQTINIVTVRSGWILSKIAERIAQAGKSIAGTEWQVGFHPAMRADINFYCDVQNCWPGNVPSNTMNIGLFTHIHANDPKTVNRNVLNLDYIFHMANRYLEVFGREFKYPYHRMNIMVPFEAPEDWKPIRNKKTIGIFQRGKYEGKGYHFMMDFIKNPVCKEFDWVFVGNDWEDVVAKMGEMSINATQYSDGAISYPDGYKRLYQQVDYVLIPSKWEGGPIACLEAMALGIPVIAADVGWCREWGAKIFKNQFNLENILASLIDEQVEVKSQKVHNICSYERCAAQILEAAKVGKK